VISFESVKVSRTSVTAPAASIWWLRQSSCGALPNGWNAPESAAVS